MQNATEPHLPIAFDSINRSVGLVINAPTVFARADFMDWLRDPKNCVFTWHQKNEAEPHEYSDVIVLVDAYYEGDSSNMPDDIWRAICDAAYAVYGGESLSLSRQCHVHVRLNNFDLEADGSGIC